MTKELQKLIARADELYRQRSSLVAVRESVDLLNEGLTNDKDCELYWRLSRAYFFLGQEAKSNSAASEYFRHGTHAAKAATALIPKSVAAQFWLGVNLALLAQGEGLWSAMMHVRRARRALSLAKGIDQSYHSAGALRVLGRIEHKLPRLLGGSKRRAREYYERAVSISPGNTVTRIFFAELLIESGDVEAAREHLQAILNIDVDGEWEFEIARDQSRAGQLQLELSQ